MDLRWNKTRLVWCGTLLAIILFAPKISFAGIIERTMDAITLAPIGISDKPLPALLLEERKSNSSKTEWFSRHAALKVLPLRLEPHGLEEIHALISKNAVTECPKRLFGTYVVGIWSGKSVSNVFLSPHGAESVLGGIAKCEISDTEKTILSQAIHRINESQ
jgi:hypothetical protein